MKELDPLVAIGVFVSAGAIDTLSTLYVRRVAESKAVQAGVISAAMIVLSSIAFYAFISNPLYAGAEMAGAFTGTFMAVKWDSRNKPVPKT